MGLILLTSIYMLFSLPAGAQDLSNLFDKKDDWRFTEGNFLGQCQIKFEILSDELAALTVINGRGTKEIYNEGELRMSEDPNVLTINEDVFLEETEGRFSRGGKTFYMSEIELGPDGKAIRVTQKIYETLRSRFKLLGVGSAIRHNPDDQVTCMLRN